MNNYSTTSHISVPSGAPSHMHAANTIVKANHESAFHFATCSDVSTMITNVPRHNMNFYQCEPISCYGRVPCAYDPYYKNQY